jgi:sec-independent protein translocase protein TatB
MFDIGWSELAIIAVVALVVLGPKELANSMRTLGQWAGRARALAQEFRRGLDDLARESEIKEVAEKLDSVRNFDLGRHIDAATEPSPAASAAQTASQPGTPAQPSPPASGGASPAPSATPQQGGEPAPKP